SDASFMTVRVFLALLAGIVVASAIGSSRARGDDLASFQLTSHGRRRFLTSDQEVTVPIRLVNTGHIPWDPRNRFNVSYHWWTALDREVEYDGLRTALPRRVDPEDAITIEARLRAPDRPGLYLLQWDVVQEEVQWLSERNPGAQPRYFVLV